MLHSDHDRETIEDIRDAAERIVGFVSGIDETAFYADVEKQSAVMYQALIIGEATKRLSPAARAAFPDIAWQQMARLRDILVHHYGKVSLRIVWEVASIDVPTLLVTLQRQRLLDAEGDDK